MIGIHRFGVICLFVVSCVVASENQNVLRSFLQAISRKLGETNQPTKNESSPQQNGAATLPCKMKRCRTH